MNQHQRFVYTAMVLIIGFGLGMWSQTTENPVPMLLIPFIAFIGLFEFGGKQ